MAKVSKIGVMLGTWLHKLGVLPCSSSLQSMVSGYEPSDFLPTIPAKGLWSEHTIPWAQFLLSPYAHPPHHCQKLTLFLETLFTEVVDYWLPVAVAPQHLFDSSNPEAELTYEGLRV